MQKLYVHFVRYDTDITTTIVMASKSISEYAPLPSIFLDNKKI